MVDARRGTVEPDYAVPPGETLRETLELIGMSQADLARRADLSTKHVNQIIQGEEAPITPETAVALERVVRVPARIWNSLEANYQAQRIRIAQRRRLDPIDLAWLKRLPTAELVRRKTIPGSNDAHLLYDQILRFGVASRNAWEKWWLAPEAAFRQSPAFQADEFSVATGFVLGELRAAEIETEPFDRTAFREALDGARELMTREPAEFFPGSSLVAKRASPSSSFLR